MSLSKIVLAAAFSVSAFAAQAATFSATSASPFGLLPDANAAGVTRTVDVAQDVVITDVDLSLTLSTTWIGDMILTLTSPGGTAVDLLCRPGRAACRSGGGFGDSSDLDGGTYTFDDEAPNSILGSLALPTLPAGSYVGQELLSAFDGQSTLGMWTVNVSDNAGGDQNFAGAFTLAFTHDAAPVPLPASLPLLLAGLGGVAVMRRKARA